MHLIQQQLSVFDAAPGIFEVQRASPDGFYFRTAKLDARFHFFFHKIFMIGFPVPGHDLNAILFQTTHLPFSMGIIP